VTGIISSYFGDRINPVTGQKEFHNGIDIYVPEKTEIKAVADGVIQTATSSKTFGNFIIQKTDNNYEIAYGHLNKILVKQNARVKKNQIIALSGQTGLATGPHLHFGIKYQDKFLDPIKFLSFKE